MIPQAWQADRETRFPITRSYLYMDHAGIAPLPGDVRSAISSVADHFAAQGAVAYDSWFQLEDDARQRAATLLGTGAEHIAWIPNTGSGLSLAAAGLSWQPGDVVIVAEHEFPANVYPWLRLADHGVDVQFWDLGEENETAIANLSRIVDKAGDALKLIACSWVQYHTGRILPIREMARLAHEVDALAVVDAIQGLGILPFAFDAWEIDLVAADGHKWLLGPEGFGLCAVSDRAMTRIEPVVVGWHSVATPFPFDQIDWTPAPDARRYEPGTWNLLGLAGLNASMQLLLEAEICAIRSAVKKLEAVLREQLNLTTPPWPTAGHVFVPLAGDLSRAHLLERGVVAQVRGGRLRLSPHAYLSESEILEASNIIKKLRHASG